MKLLSNVMLDPDLVLPVPVIVVEDEPLIQKRLKEILLGIGYLPENLIFAQTLAQAH